MPEPRPVTRSQPITAEPLARGSVTYQGISRGQARWSFAGDVAPRWFRSSGARFVVTDGVLTLNGAEVAIGTVFGPGSL